MIDHAENEIRNDVIKEIVTALLKERDFLACHLSYCKNLITKDEYEKALHEYVSIFPEPPRMPELKEKVHVLCELAPEYVDAELVSTIFQCGIIKANRAIKLVIKDLEDSNA